MSLTLSPPPPSGGETPSQRDEHLNLAALRDPRHDNGAENNNNNNSHGGGRTIFGAGRALHAESLDVSGDKKSESRGWHPTAIRNFGSASIVYDVPELLARPPLFLVPPRLAAHPPTPDTASFRGTALRDVGPRGKQKEGRFP